MKKQIIILSMLPFFLISCVVSKKKYEELEYAKRRSDAKVIALDKENLKKGKDIAELNSQLDLTLAEYNEMKNSMSESNAKKNTEIDDLSTELMGLASDTTELKVRLMETLDKYNSALNVNDENNAKISALLNQIEDLRTESGNLSRELNTANTEVEWQKKKITTELQKNQDVISVKDKQIENLKAEIAEKDGKLGWLRKIKDENEAEIEKLTNQVKLYKKEYEKAISK
ncbi:coiled-coil domain-containing protein [Labilibaculum sp.]|uniref:coiled-coil domain-containing protein n=1 Tax=Labilibaculum sp. TaxID=2060723 RepID=UPI003565EE8D